MRYPARPDQKRRYLRKLALSMFGFMTLLMIVFGAIIVNRSIRTLRDDYASFSRQLLGSVSLSSESRYRSALSLAIGALWQRGTISTFMYADAYDAVEEPKVLNELRLQMVHNDAIHSVYLYNNRTGVFSVVEPVFAESGPAEQVYLRYLTDGFAGFSRAIAFTAYESESRSAPRRLISIIAKDIWWKNETVDRAIIINLKEEAFVASVGSQESESIGQLFVIGRDGVTLAANDSDYFAQNLGSYQAVERAMTAPARSGTFETRSGEFPGESTYFVSYTRNRTLGWTFLYVTDSRRLRAEYSRVLTTTLWILVPTLVIGLLLSLGLARRLYSPIERIISRIQREHPAAHVHERTISDLDYLEESIDEMTSEIRLLSDAADERLDAEVRQATHHALAGTISTAESERLHANSGHRFPAFPLAVGTVAVDPGVNREHVSTDGKATSINRLRFLTSIRSWASKYDRVIVIEHMPLQARILFPLAASYGVTAFRAALGELLRSLNDALITSYSAAMSEPANSVEDLHEAAEMTDDLLRYRRMLGRRQILSPRDIELTSTADFSYPTEIERRMYASVKARREDEFAAAARELFAYLGGYDVGVFEYASTQVLLNVIREMNVVLRRGKASTIVGYDEVSRLSLAMGIPEHVELYRSVFELFAAKYEATVSRRSSRSELTVTRVRAIVEANLSNHNLDLTFIADDLNLSPNYLSRLFKDETGQNLTTYVRDARMNLACELLTSKPDLSIAEIAAECGYADVNYFSYSFRSSMGVAPSIYRSNEDRDEPAARQP